MRLWQWLEVGATVTPSIYLFPELGMLTYILLYLCGLRFGTSYEYPSIVIAQSSADQLYQRSKNNDLLQGEAPL